MAGLIRDDDIALVRERARIDEVVSSYVTLKHAGGGSQKGLCPFHDEKSPSFNVNPSRGFFHCFGCGEGGDVIAFLMKIDGLAFSEAVERLADKYGVQLRYQEGTDRPAKRDTNLRAADAGGAQGRPGLLRRAARHAGGAAGPGVPHRAAASTGTRPRPSGWGSRPRGGDDLFKYLRQKGFADAEIVTGGLVGQGQRGHYDRFRGRLLWPIRETNGDVIGFGARRIFDDDRIDAKYLNTPETPIYKKSQVLYGIDLARRDIARASQAVVVEGYTDVMACHLAGVSTAVATCGTAFGEDHSRLIRRLLTDHDDFRGEVIFTFDGDAAGQKAALRAFEGDQNFAGQTYVAVEPSGLDPCDLRLKEGTRPSASSSHAGCRCTASCSATWSAATTSSGPTAGSTRCARPPSWSPRSATAPRWRRSPASSPAWSASTSSRPAPRCAAPPAAVPTSGSSRGPRERVEAVQPEQPAAPPLPNLRDPRFSLERETLKLVVQHPQAVGRMAKDVDDHDFTHPTYRGVWAAVTACGGPANAPGGEAWVAALRDKVSDPAVVSALSALAVEPLLSIKEPTTAYVAAHVFRLQEITAMRRIADLKSKLQRTNPVEHATDYNRMFGELVALEQHRRALRERAIGGEA